jgi:lipopolysaccharide/colanic/teichoic acid biosynthesis glycosyltransferase
VIVALTALAAVLPLAALVAVLVRFETGGVLVSHPRAGVGGGPGTVPRFRTRRARSLGRPGTTWSVAISGRAGPIGRAVRWTRLDLLPELVQLLLRRAIHPRTGSDALGSARASGSHQPKVDAGQLLA